jgi:DNA-binding beta-propeller fold protein YncE
MFIASMDNPLFIWGSPEDSIGSFSNDEGRIRFKILPMVFQCLVYTKERSVQMSFAKMRHDACPNRASIILVVICILGVTIGIVSAEDSNVNHPPVININGYSDFQYLMKWGSYGTGPGQFYYPRMATIDDGGYIYITDVGNNRTQKFDLNGNFILEWGSGGSGPGQFHSPQGIVVRNGFVYVCDYTNNRIQKFDTQGNFVKEWGSKGSLDGQFSNPVGIAIDSQGYLYVSDMSNHRIQKFDSDGNFVLKWGGYGSGDGKFNRQLGIAVDSDDYVYVVEPYNLRVQKFDTSGNFILKWGSVGTGEGQFVSPFNVAVDSKGYIYVSDLNRADVQIFDSEGNYITKFGTSGNLPGQFLYPCGMAFDDAGNFYEGDQLNHRVQKFTPSLRLTVPEMQTLNLDITGLDLDADSLSFSAQNLPRGAIFDPVTANFTWTPTYDQAGIYSGIIFTVSDGTLTDSRELIVNVTQVNLPPVLESIGPKSVDEGQTLTITPIATDHDGDPIIYTVTGLPVGAGFSGTAFTWTPEFWQAGTYSVTFKASDGSLTDNETVTITVNDVPQNHAPILGIADSEDYQYLMKWGSYGTGPGQFYYPRMATIDDGGYIYITDVGNNRTQKFDLNGNFILEWGSGGSGPGQFHSPQGIVVRNGFVYVCDYTNNRIQKFDTQGNFVKEWGSKGSLDGQFSNPVGIAIDSQGYLYVSDMSNHRIQKFDSDGNFVLKWGGYGSGDGKFNRQLGIAVDSDDYVYVVEPYNLRVQKFDTSGNFILKWGSVGTGEGQFVSPFNVAVDSKGYIYVSDLNRADVQIFDSEGNYITKFGTSGNLPGQFLYPCGMAFDDAGNFYEGDQLNHRVQKFTPSLRLTVPEMQTLNLDITGLDLDADSLSFSAQNLPRGAIFDPVTANFTWTPTYDQAGIYSGIIFTVSDGTLTDSRELIVNVTQVNLPPVLESIGPKSINAGQLLQFTVSASDPDGDLLIYSVENLPAGATFSDATFTWTPGFDQTGTYPDIQFIVTDGTATDSENITITVSDFNNPPVLAAIGNKDIDEGQLLQFTISATDPDGDQLSYTAKNLPAGATFSDATFTWTPGFDQTGTYPDIQFIVTDGAATDSENITIVVIDITLDDEAPLCGEVIAAPNPVQLNTPIVVTTTIDDTTAGNSVISGANCLVDGVSDTMSVSDDDFDEPVEDVTFTINGYPTAGVHNISVTAIDAAGNPAVAEEILLAVYDPSAGFVTGGGWIISPAGAYYPDPTMTGKATFGFVSKYQKGANIPTGQTEFQFKTGNLNFKSTSYDWLVVAGAKAQYKGVGTINGVGEYGFMLTAIDGAIKGGDGTDLFRIKIWDRGTDAIVYDNQMGASDTSDPTTVISGGSIVIHTK